MTYASPKNVSTEATKGLQLGIWGLRGEGLNALPYSRGLIWWPIST